MLPGGPLPFALALALLAGAPAHPGAWPREPGAAFVSLRAETGGAEPASGALYGEYGLTGRVTLVGQISRDGGEEETPTRVSAALNYALSPPDAVHRFAVSLGASAPPSPLGAAAQARAEAALHWGRGFETRFGGGWATATARLALARDEARPITDLYALVGLRPSEGWMAMLSASRYEDAGGVTFKISPSAGYQVHERAWIVPSVTRDFSAGETRFGLSVWLNF